MESTVAKKVSVEKILKFEDDLEDKFKDWKTKLTGALDNSQVFMSLFILICFNAIYAIINHCLENNRDQYTITAGCHCRDNAKKPYRRLFYAVLSAWFAIHTYIFIKRNFKDLEIFVPRHCMLLPVHTLRECMEMFPAMHMHFKKWCCFSGMWYMEMCNYLL